MKKLLLKVYIMLFFSLVAIFILDIILAFAIHKYFNNIEVEPASIFWLNMISGFCAMVIFTVLINRLIIKRIKNLSSAVREVSDGNYNISLNDNGKDEISVLTNEFNSMTRELNSNDYLNKEFTKNVSHEIKTPLSSIQGYADLIANGKLTEEENIEYAQIISKEASRLYNLSRQMLNISIVDASVIIKKEDVFRVDEQIRNTLLLTQREWQRKNLTVDADMEDITIKGNEQLCYHIWQNLISNAIKFTNDQGKIAIKLYKDDDLHFEIIDNGIGISEADQEKLFTQFYTVDKSKSSKNTGLGLSLVKKIVDKLEGTITLTSKLGEGTTVKIKIPYSE